MKLMFKIILLLFIVTIVIITPAVYLLVQNQNRTLLEQAYIRAQTIHKMIVITRQWVAENGDRVEPVPAVVTKELSQYAKTMSSFRFHITSDNLVNLDNAPTEFELEAMDKINNTNVREYSRTDYDETLGDIYLYAAPLFINESCMNCHSEGYKLNDFRGLISIKLPLSDLKESLSRSNTIIVYTIVAGFILIVVIISLIIHWLIMRHLNTLTNATRQIKQGNIVQTNINTNDEIAVLSDAFDQMSRQIAYNEEILTAKLEEAVGKYIKLVDELKDKNDKLDSINQLKTELLDSIAHEIRTPLTKILSYSELLDDHRILDDKDMRSKFTLSMKNNIKIIKNMFNDIITLSRLEHGQYDYHPIYINLYSMIKEKIDLFDLEIKNKSLTLKIDINPSDSLYIDGETFNTVITNIISNSIKYSKPNTDIEINAYTELDKYIIKVKDYGIGIPKDELNLILIKFHRCMNVKKEYSGTGLGLSIVSRIIKANNGTLEIDSIEHEWTEVTITFNKDDIT